MTPCGFPHSEISGSTLIRQLAKAYRSLSRPLSVRLRLGIHRMLLSNFLCILAFCIALANQTAKLFNQIVLVKYNHVRVLK